MTSKSSQARKGPQGPAHREEDARPGSVRMLVSRGFRESLDPASHCHVPATLWTPPTSPALNGTVSRHTSGALREGDGKAAPGPATQPSWWEPTFPENSSLRAGKEGVSPGPCSPACLGAAAGTAYCAAPCEAQALGSPGSYPALTGPAEFVQTRTYMVTRPGHMWPPVEPCLVSRA